jgi:hypothetical protein
VADFKPLKPEAAEEYNKYQNDLRYFCRKALKIKLKGGGEAPFVWNRAQEYLHARIESQLQKTGKVRLFILKGRQQGISTYIAARLYHKATRLRGRRVFILSHHSSTTGTLFQIVDTYHNSCPDAIKPRQILNNNRQMRFANNSQYTVGTAGTGDIDRGNTNQYFHWSEVAFSENIDGLLTGVFQTVADVDGTEKLLESTANGTGNYFHTGCLAAMSGDDEYELVFIPWYWQPEYRAELRPDFELTDEERALKTNYGLDNKQLQWRRNKIAEFKKNGEGDRKFKQEYPCSVKEAFQFSGSSLVDGEAVATARKSKIKDPAAPLILGVDPAPINDRTTITWRRGREWIKTERFIGLSQMALCGKLIQRIEKYDVAKVFVDVGEGRGAVDRAKELGYGDTVIGVAFSSSPTDDELYLNKRSEMAGEAKLWLEDELGVSIPDGEGSENVTSGDEIEVEIGAIPVFIETSNGRRKLEDKKKIEKAYGKSPDIWDSFMLTFAQKVRMDYNQSKRVRKAQNSGRSELSAINKRRKPAKSVQDDFDDEPKGYYRSNSKFRRPR